MRDLYADDTFYERNAVLCMVLVLIAAVAVFVLPLVRSALSAVEKLS